MKIKHYIFFLLISVIVSCNKTEKQTSVISPTQKLPISKQKTFNAKNIGDTLDVFNNVYVIYNKSMNNTSGRHLTKDGYNLGLKWQCVEFVKRYYYEHLNHKMPNSYGHAKDFFNAQVLDGNLNTDRNLLQFTNGSTSLPKVNDLLIFSGNVFNPYGHVAIISEVGEDYIEIVQQNVGKTSRDKLDLEHIEAKWTIDESNVLGWLRKQN